jgi:lipoprotein-anchoring transpeptidase ErfK/SrfK
VVGYGVAVVALIAVTVVVAYWLRPPTAAPSLTPTTVTSASGGTTTVTATGSVTVSTTGGAATSAGAGEAAADDGLALASSGRLFQAQLRLSEALKAGIDGPKGKTVREKLAELADKLQFSHSTTPEDIYSKMYTAVKNDALVKMGNKFMIPYQLIKKINGLTSDDITEGQQLKVVQGPMTIDIFKSKYELQVWCDKVCVRVFPIGIGADNKTPEGTFVIVNKEVNPKYEPLHKGPSAFKASGAADNPLGSRWIDIGNHYGIHGTIDPTSIGKNVSEGCIRLNNKDVEEVFDLVALKLSKVTIHP